MNDTLQLVPRELRERPQWIVWKYIGEDRRKVPFQANGTPAKSNDPQTWTTFDRVAARCNGAYAAGFVFASDDPFCGIDLDGCRNPQTGEIKNWAIAILAQLDSYTEVSPSKTGVKIWVRGSLRGRTGKKQELTEAPVADRTPAIEMYDQGRYFAVTGNRLDEYGDVIQERQSAVDDLLATYFPDPPANGQPPVSSCPKPRANRQPPMTRPPDVLERARRYVAKMPPAISGHKGHNATFRVACVLTQGFALGEADALELLREYNCPQRCDPPWTEKELQHKIDDALKQPGERGYLLRRPQNRPGTAGHAPKPSPAPSPAPVAVSPWTPFPTDAFPEPCRQFISEAARAIGCDPSYVALPLLSGLAAAIGNTRTIRLKPTWDEPSVIWTAIVGDSGTMKSPAVDAPLKPIRKRQEVAFKVHCEAMQRYERDRELHEAAKLAWRKKRNTTEPPPEKPTPPVCDRYWCSDITVEALAARLAHAPRGLLLVRDELAGWLKSFDQYKGGKGGDSAHWLTIHGARDLIVDRKTGDKTTIYVPRAAVSICGGVQPEILRAALGREHFQDGLAARLLLANPRRLPKRWTEANVSHALEIEMANVFAKLWELEPDLDVDGESQPKTLPLTPEAKAAWIEFYDRHGREQAEVIGDLAAAFSKLEGYAARLALVLHCVRVVTGEADPRAVDVTNITAGIRLVEWFKGETRRVYSTLAESDDNREQRQLVEMIERKGGTITVRDLTHSDRRFKGQSEAAESVLNGLVKSGRGAWETISSGPTGGKPKDVFRLVTTVPCPHNLENPAENQGNGDGDTHGEPAR